MKTVKFRAWDKKNKRFGYITVAPYGIHWPSSDWIEQKLLKFSYNDGSGVSFENIEAVMQFTGLKDKNGKEIYEGDIIMGVQYGLAAQVVWDNRFSRFIVQKGTELERLGMECEVIGNIYENPELLEDPITMEELKLNQND